MKSVQIAFRRLIFLSVIYLSTTGYAHAQQLPDSWEKGMALTTYYGAGMRQQTDLLRIADDSSFERHSGMDNNKKYTFRFSVDELNKLLAFLKAKHFDKIDTGSPAVISDGWSSDITLQWKGHVISINTGAAYTVPDVYRKDLSDILSYVDHMVEQKKIRR